MTEKDFEAKFIEFANWLGIIFGVPLALYVLIWIGTIIACLISTAWGWV